MEHPRRAARDPLKGATLADWQSQIDGVHGKKSCAARANHAWLRSFVK
jgi:hypothetical protein